MTNIKYELLPSEEREQGEKKPSNWIVKIFFLSLVIFTLAIYTLSCTDSPLKSSAALFSPWRPMRLSVGSSWTNNLGNSSRLLDVIYTTETTSLSRMKQTETTEETHTESSTEDKTEISTIAHTDKAIESSISQHYALEESGRKYFVNSPKCKMSHPNPFARNIQHIYKKHSYIVCDKSRDMITVIFNESDSTYRLHKNENSTCCFKQILRAGSSANADNQYKLRPCVEFQQDHLVPNEVTAMLTYCRRPPFDKVSQMDAFSFVHPRKDQINNRTSLHKRRPSVLLWGIDSISRMTLELTMPRMYEYLNNQHWFELQGYNKMGDNTFPNLMAILTGFNKTYANARCHPDKVRGLDACPFIWKDFKDKGYTTAYAEDWSKFSTFDYSSSGFFNPPTDVYGRPLVLAVENELRITQQGQMPYCLGRKPASEYIYDLGVQFTMVNRNSTFFGMFWTNTFSHNDFSMPSVMDERMVKYMRTLDKNGIMDNTIIIFFSDHGTRFGPLRKLDSGFVDERLPFIYIRVPRWIREKYPKLLRNLQVNRNRLTSPYDIHASLRHILELDTPKDRLPRPEGCSTCHSVFEEVDWSRNCSQAGIEEHWCTCDTFSEVATTDPSARSMSTQLVESINKYVASKKGAERCRLLKLNRISSVQRRGNSSRYLIQLSVMPGDALFEATVEWDASAQRIPVQMPSISRLNTYAKMSKCSSVKEIKKYCIC
ncbi:uncharacterized protein LOC6553447 [Drosophila erecta]|uniref:GG24177 n=1 Tax=Drosophila erecta TaxID=7220 RepID=B3P318_DROER|nr:uncharacterized protein LOC6553447 [Drosophila erecta]EDV48332.1 uncharacterized protein Dere_GG24177 [Drosophila erecta]